MLTAAQREQQERLRMKHLEIQKSIMAQQEELRRISEQLLLSTWGPSVLKVNFLSKMIYDLKSTNTYSLCLFTDVCT